MNASPSIACALQVPYAKPSQSAATFKMAGRNLIGSYILISVARYFDSIAYRLSANKYFSLLG